MRFYIHKIPFFIVMFISKLALRDLVVKVDKIKILEKLNVGKGLGSDGIFSWIMGECREHLHGKIEILIQNFLKKIKALLNWKCARIQ